MSVGVCELFALPERASGEEDLAYRIRGEEVNVEQMLRDSLALALPFTPLCRKECRGLCASCGQDLNAGECDCREQAIDPRWAPLEALRQRLET